MVVKNDCNNNIKTNLIFKNNPSANLKSAEKKLKSLGWKVIKT